VLGSTPHAGQPSCSRGSCLGLRMQHLPDEVVLPALRWAWVILMRLMNQLYHRAAKAIAFRRVSGLPSPRCLARSAAMRLMSSGMPLRANQRLSPARLNATIRNAICMRLCILGGPNTLGLSVTCGRYGAISTVLVQLGGLEPPTSCSTDRRSNQLSYNCIARAGLKKRPRMGGKLGATPAFGKAARHPIVVVSKALRRSPRQQKARASRPGFSQRTMPGDQAAGL
jgi:hypothetical protein